MLPLSLHAGVQQLFATNHQRIAQENLGWEALARFRESFCLVRISAHLHFRVDANEVVGHTGEINIW